MPDTARLLPPPAGLGTCLYAALVRDTRPLGDALPPEQRLNRFPALPFAGITWILEGNASLLAPTGHPDLGPLPPVFVSGPQSAPFASRNDGPIHTFCLVFHPQAFGPLTGAPLAHLRDRHRPLAEALPTQVTLRSDGAPGVDGPHWSQRAGGPDWAELDRRVRSAPDDTARLAAAAQWLLPHWQAARGRLDQRLADLPQWLRSLPVHAVAALAGWTPRQLERRSRQATGLTPQEWRAIERGHAAVLADDARVPLAQAAQAQGYADQPHMTRSFRKLIGASPAALRRHLASDDESWWLYRLRRHGRP